MDVAAAQINLGKTCLSCNKALKDPEACRKHMLDKSHAKLRYGLPGDEEAEEELEVRSFLQAFGRACHAPFFRLWFLSSAFGAFGAFGAAACLSWALVSQSARLVHASLAAALRCLRLRSSPVPV